MHHNLGDLGVAILPPGQFSLFVKQMSLDGIAAGVIGCCRNGKAISAPGRMPRLIVIGLSDRIIACVVRGLLLGISVFGTRWVSGFVEIRFLDKIAALIVDFSNPGVAVF